MPTNIGGVVLGELVLGATAVEGGGGGGETPTQFGNVHHTLNLTQSIVQTLTKINSLYIPFQTIGMTYVANKTVASTLGLTQSIIAHNVRGVSQTLPLSQSIVAYASKGVFNTLTFNQSISYNINRNAHIIHTLRLNHLGKLTRTKSEHVHHGFGMNSIIKQHREFNKTVNDVLNLSQEIRRIVYLRSVESIYLPTHSISSTPVYLNSVSSALSLSQSIGLNMILNRSVTNNLIFLPVRTIYVGMGDVQYYTVDNIQYSLIPAYKVGKKNKPHCVLQVNNAAITLPSPEWGDTENYGGVFTIRRSMNGIPYTHIRSLSLRKLKLPWTLAKRKAWELREFLIQYNAELMTLTTWKGDKWFVNLTTNPFDLAVRGRYEAENEKVDVELEFEGLKVM